MNIHIIFQLIDNAALLLALSVIFNFGYMLPAKFQKCVPFIAGFTIGLIAIAIMSRPFEFSPGVIFDTRSIALSVTAFVFGVVPAIIVAVMTIIYRMIIGGVGIWSGSASIVVCTCIGLLWRHYFFEYKRKFRWINIYLFGIVTNIGMLACIFLLPWPISVQTLQNVTFTTLILYPIVTVCMCLLLIQQKKYNEAVINVSESEGRYQTLFNNNLAIMLIIDQNDGSIVDANPAACSFYGWPLEIMKTMKMFDINVMEPEIKNTEISKMIKQSKSYFAFQHRKASGEIVDVEAYSYPFKLEGRMLMNSIVHDVSERKKIESEKKEIQAQLWQHQKMEAIGTLAGGIAHEINNPVNGIMNYAQLMIDSLEEDSKNAGYAREIVRESERVSVIVKNLLQYSRQDKQSHSYVIVEDIINNTLSLVNSIIKKDQISIKVDIEDGLPSLKCRSNEIQQVLMNLFTNARDALNEKYPGYHDDKSIYVSCRRHVDEDHKWIRISVEDHGTGIRKEIQEKIYEPFFSTKSKENGTGLGLAISYGIVKEHNGRFTFETQEGEFTRFHLDLPVDDEQGMEGDD